MYYNENADLSDGEDGELLPLDTEVGTDDIEVGSHDDQENQADAVASAATTTTAASEEEEDLIANLVEEKTSSRFEKK